MKVGINLPQIGRLAEPAAIREAAGAADAPATRASGCWTASWPRRAPLAYPGSTDGACPRRCRPCSTRSACSPSRPR